METVSRTDISEYPLVSQGKVRDMYAIDEHTLLIVTTDRMSAFDVVLPDPIPYKGMVLNQLTVYWMERLASLVDNHLLAVRVSDFPAPLHKHRPTLEGRSVLVRRAGPLPIECIVRGYLSGSGWKDYERSSQVCGIDLPDGLRESDRLPKPLFTPSTKAEQGAHDENITLEQAKEAIGPELFERARELSLSIFSHGASVAENNGLIIADTKFEFGRLDNELLLIDEVLTPDSSRFWPMQSYRPGQAQPSFDKQYLRDWLKDNWDFQGQPPRLPDEVVMTTRDKYLEAFRLLTGDSLERTIQ